MEATLNVYAVPAQVTPEELAGGAVVVIDVLRASTTILHALEAGAAEIIPWSASRSIVCWSGDRGERALARWRSTAQEAAKQSRRLWVPGVADPMTTAEVARRIAGADAAVVLHEAASATLAVTALPDDGEVVVVVGPEGGIAPEELDAFVAA